MPQLVGRNCIRCGERIADELESRFCRRCGSPVHDRCAQPTEAGGCPVCGATVVVPEPVNIPAPSPPPAAPDEKPKREKVAFLLNFLFPGLGLWYLGMQGWAVVNLLVFLGIIAVFVVGSSEDEFERTRPSLATSLSVVGGVLALGLAKRHNARRQAARRA